MRLRKWEQAYSRARELCRQIGEVPQLFPVLRGLWAVYTYGLSYKTARELGEQCLSLAQRQQDSALLVEAHYALGEPCSHMESLPLARAHLEQGIAVYDPQKYPLLYLPHGHDPGVGCLFYAALSSVVAGLSRPSPQENPGSVALAQELSHPFSLAFALLYAASAPSVPPGEAGSSRAGRGR